MSSDLFLAFLHSPLACWALLLQYQELEAAPLSLLPRSSQAHPLGLPSIFFFLKTPIVILIVLMAAGVYKACTVCQALR